MFKTRGTFITLEGIDGCGKSTQTEMLINKFSELGVDYIQVREPGGTAAGEAIRQILLDNRYSLLLQTELLLYMAARSELTEEIIIPALKAGKVVLCDRFTDSTLAYQGYGGGANLEWIRILNNNATCGITPDLTILLDLPVEDALKRRINKADRMESKDYHFHQRVRLGYLELASVEPYRIKVLKATEERDSLHFKIWALAEKLIDDSKRAF
ncbi:MAG: dTMP kinase [Bacillota bacterium]|nr:dTMP kinase [Bacillota bacterium]MDW7729363.1 dTMP kinase [Bacillota bacterium]